MSIEKIFITGSGLMGGGIAQVCAQSGFRVILNDVRPEALLEAKKNISWSVGKLVEKGSVKESREEIMTRIATTTEIEAAASADLVIEAVFENLELKRDVFRRLDKAAGPGAILASNTSAISISELAGVTGRPENVLGLHFFSPVPMMGTAEVIRGMLTSEETFSRGVDFVRRLGKDPILVHRDIPAFVINRINFRANIEAMRLVEQGVATVEDIDKGLRLAGGRKMGPFETGDMVGLDVTHGALMAIYEETRDASFYPPAILRRKVQMGQLGRKTGRGWYEYNPDGTIKK
ncbi:MAG: 3-hydroxyacyl-CoA dehydrogenase family protein [Syntrophobacteraceae bacterium]|nr:3-hydroxyacyl-CoA dehydrogenase family protein [Syntrophobacteraceae bacterium]